jgi:hypothetical protein
MFEFFAPTARLMPVSLTLSWTTMYMIFATPMLSDPLSELPKNRIAPTTITPAPTTVIGITGGKPAKTGSDGQTCIRPKSPKVTENHDGLKEHQGADSGLLVSPQEH